MTTVYPDDIDTFVDKIDKDGETPGSPLMAADCNDLQDAVAAIETALGVNPQGLSADLATRLARCLSPHGNLDFTTSAKLDIASGAVTPTQNWHTVDTESSAATDDLDTIVASELTDGFVLFLRQFNSARVVTLKHDTGNINCPGGVDIVFSDTTQVVILIYDSTLTKWLATVSPANAALINKVNTFAAEQVFSKAQRRAYTSVAVNTTLDATHDVVDVDASGAARTITLPTASGINGRVYLIRKLDSSANTVTIDGYSSETINGAATKVLSTQYATAEIISDGANWIVA